MEFKEFIVEQALILIPALYIIGLILKSTDKIKDWTIPWILLVIGIVASIALMGLNINAIIQGVLVTGATVYTNQLIKQTTKKEGGLEDENSR
ncbi:phage holin family protein [Clostridium faecium]|uniref:Phage holin family protein n=1 Tax=Clostridium faecium TaxID=2762223 RepID=A0ABR8YR56_9CLOT|nr:phage holin family protein [Clostridium faecium]MBD8046739.1 phage holin family protein [Clostridium faecium]